MGQAVSLVLGNSAQGSDAARPDSVTHGVCATYSQHPPWLGKGCLLVCDYLDPSLHPQANVRVLSLLYFSKAHKPILISWVSAVYLIIMVGD